MSENSASDSPLIFYWRSTGPGRKEWPELVGLPAEEAEKKIKEEMGGVQTHVVPPCAYVTMDSRTDRVWLFVDGAGKVTRPPQIG